MALPLVSIGDPVGPARGGRRTDDRVCRSGSCGPRRRACSAARPKLENCGSSLSLGTILRARRPTKGEVLNEWGRREPQIAVEWCGQAVSEAKELDHWTSRIRDTRELALRGDRRLASLRREAQELQQELSFAKADVTELRAESSEAVKERQVWVDQAGVSKASVHALETKVVAMSRVDRRTYVPTPSVRVTPETQLVESKIADMSAWCDRLSRENTTLDQLGLQHRRQIQILNRALRVEPSIPPGPGLDAPQVLQGDLRIALRGAESRALELQSMRLEVEGMRKGSPELISEMQEASAALATAASEVASLQAEGAEVRARVGTVASEARHARARGGACELELEQARRECAHVGARLHEEQPSWTGEALEVRVAEERLRLARDSAAALQDTIGVQGEELEERGRALSQEISEQEAWLREALWQGAAQARRDAELEERQRRCVQEYQAHEAAVSELESSTAMSVRHAVEGHRWIRQEENTLRDFLKEASATQRHEEALAAHLASEIDSARNASRAVGALLEQKRRVSEEADAALQRCEMALEESMNSAQEVRERDEQLERSERSCQLMRTTLGRQLAAVHEQTSEIQRARAAAALELREERQRHHELRAQLTQGF